MTIGIDGYYLVNGKYLKKESIENILDWVEGLSESLNPIAKESGEYIYFRKTGKFDKDPNIAFAQGEDHALNEVYKQASILFSEIEELTV